MSIEYLRLKGFKSFGTGCEFSFSDGLTAIVGPNGSGKSNILDALRWVLGEGSPSALRILRQSDLVFQGSATADPSKEAEVVLRLRRDNDRATLRRQYNVENGSVLQVDGARIRIQDLDEFKSRFTLDGDSFAFIGQGEVSEAIHQRPMQRRHHLELLFGIDRYRKRREETYLRLENALAEMQRIRTLVAELENRREEIAPEVAVAVEAQGIIDNLENIRRDFYFSRRFLLEKTEREHRDRLQLTTEHCDLAVGWRDLWGAAVAGAEEKLRRNGFDEQAFLAREQALTSRRETLRRQSFTAATQIRGILADRSDLDLEKERVSASLQSVKSELEKAQNGETQLREKLESARAAFEDALRLLEENRATAERERLRRQSLRDAHAGKTLLRSRQEARLKALISLRKESEKELARLEGEYEQLSLSVTEAAQQVSDLEKRCETVGSEYSDIYAACRKTAASLQQMKRDLAAQEAELEVARENTESSVYPEPTRLLLSASRLGKMKSRPEVVAEVFSCPAEIAPALEAYLGGRQFWLLVYTFDEAQEGIELLKKRQAGRVTYLPLERCRPRSPDLSFRLPASGVVGWASELISPRSPWEPALRHLLGDLLVVRDYSLGSGLTKSGARFPIATLEGEIFAPSGTVSGGRMRQSGGAISHNRRVTELSARVDALRQKIADLNAEFLNAEKQEQKIAQQRDQMGEALTEKKNSLVSFQKTLLTLTGDKERTFKEKASAETESAALTLELEALGAELAALDAQIAELGEIPGTDGNEAPSFVKNARSETELLEERMRGASSMLVRIRREHDDLEARLAVVVAALETGRAREEELRNQLSALGQEQLKDWQALGELRQNLEKERGRVRREREILGRARVKSQKAEAGLAALRAEISAVSERIASVRAEIQQLQELWEEKYPYDAREAAGIEGGRDLTSSMRRLERELRALGSYNLGALSEDESLTGRIDYLAEQSEDVKTGIDELKGLINQTDAQVETLFSQAMADIDSRFNALFQRLFAGGEARLTLQEGTVWERGVEIFARPPGKRLQNIAQLSGGEQSLTAIAHLFAALEVAKMPLAVLDEVDAALDDYNLIRFADLAQEYSKHLQLLVMTHRRTTMERADLIYGVTMAEPGLSKVVGIDMENYR